MATSVWSRKFLHQYFATITGCLSVVSTGMHFGWPSASLPYLLSSESDIKMTEGEGAWLASMTMISNLFGSIAASFIVDIIGRKLSILISCPIYFLAWMLVAFAQNLTTLNIGRGVAGLGDGLVYTAFPMYLGEIANPKIRGLLGSSIQTSLVIGVLWMNIFGTFFSIKIAALISSTISVLCFLTFIYMPESPYYLMMKGRMKEAEESLKILNGDEVAEIFDNINKSLQENQGKKWQQLELFTNRSNRKAFYIVVGLRGIQQLTGVTAIIFYAKIIFQEASGGISPNLATILYFTIQLVCTLVSSVVVDKLGRKPLMIMSVIGSGIALTIEGTYLYIKDFTNIDINGFNSVPLIALLAFNILFNLGMGPVPIVLLGEFFPMNVKGFALCLVEICFCAVVIFISKFFQVVKDSFGMYLAFYIFTGFCLLALLFIIFLVPETKGKSLEMIQDDLKAK